jgi:putative phage-type endonuclease
MTLTGIPISPLLPGSKAWYAKMSASKVAAVLGLSPYDSRFSLYFRMNGTVDPEPQTDEQSRGHYLEPAVCRWFADQHPDFDIEPGGCWQHRDASWYTASPDRLVAVKGSRDYVAGFDAKTCSDDDGYGKPGTDEVPAHVRAQAMSQMDVVGTRRTYVAVLSAYLEFREYVIDYDEAEAEHIRDECARFMDDLANGVRPNLDEHTETYQTIRKLNPGIENVDVDLDLETVTAYCAARANLKAAESAWQYQTSVVADLLGEGRRARYLGQTIATRQSRNDGTPYLVVGRSLPSFDEEAVA